MGKAAEKAVAAEMEKEREDEEVNVQVSDRYFLIILNRYLKQSLLQLTQKKTEALAACDSGGEAILKRFYKKWSSPVLEAFYSRGGQRVFPSTVRYLTHTCNRIYLKHILP